MIELILCEKPAVGRDMARLLGIQEKREGYIVCNGGKVVTWAIGHLLQQDQPESYDPRYRSEFIAVNPAKTQVVAQSRGRGQCLSVSRAGVRRRRRCLVVLSGERR